MADHKMNISDSGVSRSQLRESITGFTVPGCMIRIWRQEELEGPINTSELAETVRKMSKVRDLNELAKMIADLPGVNAVEVKDIYGSGIVLYNDWP